MEWIVRRSLPMQNSPVDTISLGEYPMATIILYLRETVYYIAMRMSSGHQYLRENVQRTPISQGECPADTNISGRMSGRHQYLRENVRQTPISQGECPADTNISGRMSGRHYIMTSCYNIKNLMSLRLWYLETIYPARGYILLDQYNISDIMAGHPHFHLMYISCKYNV